MARQVVANVENNFIRGLITETTALTFPENGCTDLDNCTITDTGKIVRRLPFDMEENATAVFIPSEDGAICSYRWESVSGTGTINYLVLQKAAILYFYDVSTLSTPVSNNKIDFEINLDEYKASNTIYSASENPCQFCISDGNLIVVNRAIDPIVVKYDRDSDSFSITPITITIRDLKGLDDGLEVHERPGGTVSDLRTNNPEHWYNLFNQGWMTTNFLTQWDTARSDMPSNADYYWLYRGPGDPEEDTEPEGMFDNRMVDLYNPGNRHAPRGHAILDAFNPDRNAAMSAESVSTVTFRSLFPTPLDLTGTSTISGGFNQNLTAAFDGNWSHASTSCTRTSSTTTSNCYIGKTLGAGAKIYGVNFNGPNNGPFAQDYLIVQNRPTLTFRLYGKNSTAPANATDGTLLGSWVLSDNGYNGQSVHSAVRTIKNTNSPDTTYTHVWLTVVPSGTSGARLHLGEVEFLTFGDEAPATEVTYERPQCVESFAGRVFYAGVQAPSFNTNIYFTQIIEKEDQYGKCYQKNDPTAEEISDLLADDGGVIRIPELGQAVKLFRLYNQLLVFATNGIWTISGGLEGSFKANEFAIQKISNISINSPNSFVDVRGTPIWWAEDGVYTVQFDPNYNSVSILNLTDKSIRSFILDVPTLNRRFVKGAYDAAESRVVWVFNDDPDLQPSDYYKYNRVLNYNVLTQAFFPYSIDSEDYVSIRDVQTVGYSEVDGTIRFLLTYETEGDDETIEGMLFGQQRGDSFHDWKDLATELSDTEVEKNYESYFITGYKIHANLINNFQTNYVWVFLDTEEGSSCWVQSLFEWTNNPNSGRWSTPQQCYNSSLLHRNVNYRRLKLRGKGKAVQLRFYSEDGKPFSIIGFALWETSNAAP